MSTKSTAPRRARKAAKPEKPYPEYPLFPHASGRWAKKINGRLRYFGRWGRTEKGQLQRIKGDGWKDALETYKRQVDDIRAGREPREDDEQAATMADLCNSFLEGKQDKLETGELSAATFSDYRLACDRLIAHFGKYRRLDDLRPEDFKAFRASLARGRSLTTLKNNVNLSRVVLKYAYDSELVDRPIRYGQAFDRPSKKNLQKKRNEAGPKLFTSEEVGRILKAADPVMKAMALLGLNGGLGNTDLANLPQSAIDWEGGWLDYAREKTAVQRRIPLWPETVEAIKEAIALRPEAKTAEDGGLCFLTPQKNRWVRIVPHRKKEARYTRRDSLGARFIALLKTLKINGRSGLGFYTLRHVFETVGGDSKDQVAVDSIMGHSDPTMAGNYRHGIDDQRLRDVVEHVRRWVWPKTTT